MRRRVLALLVVVLMLVAMTAFAGRAFPSPQDSPSCSKGIATAVDAFKGKRQGPPKGRPKIPVFANKKAHPAPGLGGCE
jgi:hypothetical protein